jgi:hypothetical protein
MKLIELTQNQVALVDDEDYERLNQFKWYAYWDKDIKSYYAVRNDYSNGKQKGFRMHRFIMNIDDSKIFVDHKNHLTLDNQKENLRICNNGQNQHNRKLSEHSSIYKGVSWNKERKKWRALIRNDKKLIHIGRFDNEVDAGKAYNLKAKELFGEFALLNEI